MCLILDANKYSDFLDPENEDMEPVRNWIKKKKGKIVYAPTGKLKTELDNHGPMKRRIKEYRQAGRIKLADPEKVNREIGNLPEISSDDRHIIALAIVSNVKLLVSKDQKLQDDFKKIARGKIYKNKSHKHLLKSDLCP